MSSRIQAFSPRVEVLGLQGALAAVTYCRLTNCDKKYRNVTACWMRSALSFRGLVRLYLWFLARTAEEIAMLTHLENRCVRPRLAIRRHNSTYAFPRPIVCRGLTKTQAQELMDRLETDGQHAFELRLDESGFGVVIW
jgi:hypothetical protein